MSRHAITLGGRSGVVAPAPHRAALGCIGVAAGLSDSRRRVERSGASVQFRKRHHAFGGAA